MSHSIKEKMGVLRHQERLCIPDVGELRELIMEAAHGSEILHSPGCHKDLPRLIRNLLVEWYEKGYSGCCCYMSKCQQVKAEHQRPGGLTLDINIPTWKWEDINMYS